MIHSVLTIFLSFRFKPYNELKLFEQMNFHRVRGTGQQRLQQRSRVQRDLARRLHPIHTAERAQLPRFAVVPRAQGRERRLDDRVRHELQRVQGEVLLLATGK